LTVISVTNVEPIVTNKLLGADQKIPEAFKTPKTGGSHVPKVAIPYLTKSMHFSLRPRRHFHHCRGFAPPSTHDEHVTDLSGFMKKNIF